ncbi:LysR substrate-binding domain-containing protein [Paraburkholderia sp. J12]|uniref:LysR substrate-binding domain-containing protein n=1 Tax=Paraburkholderia sp. J12 TaxID=2805432 RepID=UPI002ABD804A|nr:LysR substrate-binding domain-containing protein [Paraburkholderia sp. J12]
MATSRLPPLQTLRVFEAAVRLRSFTRAADELALTQGAVSQHVRALEAQLEIALFSRGRTGVEPTAQALALALQVRQGLRVLERAFGLPSVREVRATRLQNETITLVVSTLPAVALRWLAPRLPRFHARHPEIRIDLRMSVQLARLDSRDRVDVALRYGPGHWPGLSSEKLMDEEVFPVASPAYRDGRLPRRLADLARCTLLVQTAQPWEPWFQAAALALEVPDDAPVFDDMNRMLDAAADGAGIALARRSLVEAELADGRLIRLWRRSIVDVHAYYLVWRAESKKRAAIETFRAWLRREAAASVRGGMPSY